LNVKKHNCLKQSNDDALLPGKWSDPLDLCNKHNTNLSSTCPQLTQHMKDLHCVNAPNQYQVVIIPRTFSDYTECTLK